MNRLEEINRIIKLVKENNARNNVEIVSSLLALKLNLESLEKELKQTKLNFRNSQTHSKNHYKKLKEKYEKLERAYKNNEVMVRDLNELITRNLELKKENQELQEDYLQMQGYYDYYSNENIELNKELKRCQEYIKKSTNDHKNLIIDNGKMKKAIKILKDKFEVVICKSDFPISELKYSIGFKINNDGVWAYIPQEDCELLEGVFNYE